MRSWSFFSFNNLFWWVSKSSLSGLLDMEESKQWSFVGTGMDVSTVLLLMRTSITDGGYFRLTAVVGVTSSSFTDSSSSSTPSSVSSLTTSSLLSILLSLSSLTDSSSVKLLMVSIEDSSSYPDSSMFEESTSSIPFPFSIFLSGSASASFFSTFHEP